MPKTIRPERLYADHNEKAIVVVYTVQRHDELNNEISSQEKHTKILTKSIDDNTDLHKLAKKVVKQCKYIPQQWTYQVEEALAEIQERGDNQQNPDDLVPPFEIFEQELDEILEMFYGDMEDKIAASSKVLSFCSDVAKIEYIAQHHQLVSAMTRIHSDRAIYSPKLSFNICKIFHSLSNFDRYRPLLIKYQVGSTVMTTIEQEISICLDNNQRYDEPMDKNYEHYCVISVCFSIVMRFSDEIEVLRKMMKKGLAQMLVQAISIINLPKFPLKCVLFLLRRATVFGETAGYCCDEKCPLIDWLVSSLHKHSNDDIIVSSTLSILHNLSFHKECRYKMVDAGLPLALTPLLEITMAVLLLYQISTDIEQRRQMWECTELRHGLLKALNLSTDDIPTHFSAVLVNLTCDALWAETISSDNQIMDKFVDSGDLLIAKVVRNVAQWTYDLQRCINAISLSKDQSRVRLMTHEPDQYVLSHGNKEHGTTSDDFTLYQDKKFWSSRDRIPSIVRSCTTGDVDSLLLEKLGTLNHLTCYDMLSADKWDNLMSKYPLTALMRKVCHCDLSSIDIKLEAIILCTQICRYETCAKVMVESQVIINLIKIWEECNGDAEVHLHILRIIEALLRFEGVRNSVMMGTDAMEHIHDSLGHPHVVIRQTAMRCVDVLADYDGDKDDLGLQFASMERERRYLAYNDQWLCETNQCMLE